MRAVLVKDGRGPSSSLYIDDNVPVPQIKEGEVLVQVKAFGLNRMDIIQRNGRYPVPPGTSKILGVEFAGLVHEVSKSAQGGFSGGDRVYGLVSGGAYAEYVPCEASMLMKIPEELSFEEAASIPEVWMTATQVVKLVGGLKEGDNFLFHAGASGVGLAAIQIAQGEGANKVYCTVGSDEKKQSLLKNVAVSDCKTKGVLVPINYKTEDWVAVIQEKTAGVNLIVDPVGQSYFNEDLSALVPEGRLVLMGTMSGNITESTNVGLVLYKRLRIEGTTLRARSLDYKVKLLDMVKQDVLPHIVSRRYKLMIDKIFDWQEISKSHDYMESNRSVGKIIIRIA